MTFYPTPSPNGPIHEIPKSSRQQQATESNASSPSLSEDWNDSLKPKRRRATAAQLQVLQSVLEKTFFPSTELRNQLAKQLGMTPRAVQIWFQNKRQGWKIKCKQDQQLEEIRVNGSLGSDGSTSWSAKVDAMQNQKLNKLTVPLDEERLRMLRETDSRGGDQDDDLLLDYEDE
jgi:hypothetical protein